MSITYSLIAVGLVSLISLFGIFTLAFKDSVLKKTVFVLVGLATGALFGDAFIHLIPQALENGSNRIATGVSLMSGILFFLVIERLLYWHHCHGEHEESSETILSHDHKLKPIGYLILTADFLHNIMDGVIIGIGFLAGPSVGIATTVAVMLHEIPQEIADFGLLIHAGWSKGRALLWNFISALGAFVGVLIASLFSEYSDRLMPLALAFTAGTFIYIAGSDLIPELHKTQGLKRFCTQVFTVAVGFIIMIGLALLE